MWYDETGVGHDSSLARIASARSRWPARPYACPSCARLHDVEVKLAADAPLFDTEIRF